VRARPPSGPPGQRGFYGSWPQVGVPAGLILANAVFLLVSSQLSDEQFLAWGWRIPFLVSILLVVVGMVIRVRILETPAFEKAREETGQVRQPLIEVLKRHPKEVLLAMGARFAENGAFYIYSAFVLVYATQHVKMDRSVVLNGLLLGAGLELIAIPLFGALSDRIGRRPVYMFGAVVTGLFAFPFFWLLDTASPAYVALALAVAFVFSHGAMYGPQGAFLSELFGTRVRYSGASLGTQLASVFAGGLAPLIATWLLADYGTAAVALYVIGMALVTIVAVALASETHRHDIETRH